MRETMVEKKEINYIKENNYNYIKNNQYVIQYSACTIHLLIRQ